MRRSSPTSKLLRQGRAAANLTQVELAKRSGESQSTISAYERGRREPSVAALDHLLGSMCFRLRMELDPVHDVDFQISNSRLQMVLDLAEHLPTRYRVRPLTIFPTQF